MQHRLFNALFTTLMLSSAAVAAAHGNDDPGASPPSPPPATTSQTRFAAILNGANERPQPVASAGFGTGLASLGDDGATLSVSLTFAGLTSGTRAAHIHCCVDAESAGPVAIDFPTRGPDAFAFDVTAGSFSRVFDLSLASTYGGGFLAANGGDPLRARATFISGFTSGLSYFNIHTANFAGGEIRGQLTAVPEPATWALLVVGFGLAGTAMRRRKVAVIDGETGRSG